MFSTEFPFRTLHQLLLGIRKGPRAIYLANRSAAADDDRVRVLFLLQQLDWKSSQL